MDRLIEIFEDKVLIDKIKSKLSHLFSVAELESQRAGKIGMEVGSVREKILVALLIYKFGKENIQTEIPITMPEVDVKLFGKPLSIKTITGIGGVKVIWTVDAPKALKFFETYIPCCEILLAKINWNTNKDKYPSGLFLIPIETQKRTLNKIGKERYLHLPKVGTNPRGVEISREGLVSLLQDKETKCIEISWKRSQIPYDPYKRWVDYWKE